MCYVCHVCFPQRMIVPNIKMLFSYDRDAGFILRQRRVALFEYDVPAHFAEASESVFSCVCYRFLRLGRLKGVRTSMDLRVAEIYSLSLAVSAFRAPASTDPCFSTEKGEQRVNAV